MSLVSGQKLEKNKESSVWVSGSWSSSYSLSLWMLHVECCSPF